MYTFNHPLTGMIGSSFAYARLMDYLAVRDIPVVCGGGYVRDLFLKKEPKDIDLFVSAESLNYLQATQILREQGYQTNLVVHEMAAEYLQFLDVSYVIEATRNDTLPIQIIGLVRNCGSAEEIIGRLDLGICQIGVDWTGAVWWTEAFALDNANNTMTVVRGETYHDKLRSTKRYNRLVQKYPGFKLVGGL